MKHLIKATIGKVARLKFKVPYNIYNEKTAFTLKGSDTISTLIDVGIDVENVIYDSMGIKSEYPEDARNDMIIATLENVNEGLLIRVPIKYIDEYDVVETVKYRRKSITIDLGSLPNDIDLEKYINALEDITRGLVGVDPVIKSYDTSKYHDVSIDTNRQLNILRKIKMVENGSYKNYLAKNDALAKLTKEIEVFKCLITNNLFKAEDYLPQPLPYTPRDH